jgi:N-acetylglucosaminyl-diphospho-decaprenol L-rhamnosyltransferase
VISTILSLFTNGIHNYTSLMGMPIDVVVCVHNRVDLTESCLRHLQAQTVDHHVIVVDDGSTDETRVRVRAEWPAVELVSFDEKRGLPQACNRGVSMGSGEIVVMLNNDVDCHPDFLERVRKPLEEDPMLGSVASLMLKPGGEAIDGIGLAADPILAGFPRLQGLPPRRASDTMPVLLGPGGSAGTYRRTAWEDVCGLDETVDAYMDDFDLAVRLRLAGWRAVAEPKAVGIHLGSATHGYRSAPQRHMAGVGRGYLMRRYGLLRGSTALRTLLTEAIVVGGDLLISRDLMALRGRLMGWKAGRARPQLPFPPEESLDRTINFRRSLAMRRGVYDLRPA